jgi:replication fork clamp-binding protein CrfC
VRNQIELP